MLEIGAGITVVFCTQNSDLRITNAGVLEANGTYGPVAVHAAYLDKRIARTEITSSVKSYLEFLQNPMQREVYTNVIPGVLNHYDLKDLAEKSGKGRVTFLD